MTKVIHQPEEMRSFCEEVRSQGKRLGLVPTMGALHEGHLSLVDAVREASAQCVALTIFVNPTQFGPNEDFDRYPRTFEKDYELCLEKGVDLIFSPEVAALYPSGYQTYVIAEEITRDFEGAHRSNHFRGVTTIVAKLFNIVGPCVAAFGRKDYQQWRVIETMVQDLNMPIEVIGSPILREPDGLAMSSRNRYLSKDQRQRALSIYQGLLAVQNAFAQGEREAQKLRGTLEKVLEPQVDGIDYISLAHPQTLVPYESRVAETAVLLTAVRMGNTRLLDNTRLGIDTLSSL